MEAKKTKKKKRLRKEVRFNDAEYKKLNRILNLYFDGCFTKYVKYPLNNKVEYVDIDVVLNKNISSELLKELLKIGNNFNQLTRFINSNKSNIGNISFSKLNNALEKIANELILIQREIMKK